LSEYPANVVDDTFSPFCNFGPFDPKSVRVPCPAPGSTHLAINIDVYGLAFFPAPGTYVLTCPKGSLGYPACRRLPSSSDGAKSSPSGWPGSSRRLEEALTSPRRPSRY